MPRDGLSFKRFTSSGLPITCRPGSSPNALTLAGVWAFFLELSNENAANFKPGWQPARRES
jgi:hypothetical protein